ncbi:hypothetical protein [Marinobacter sp. CHS3-4]|uniref:hypothetical protein n=1 Tax=Marinobacter sp. CHS3-4 TaxID=3045174 RepID=UPI0024B4B4C7|nr:hypothetical protein [Marinobacter sp. CHS3-4]MDI9246529.1 hypothetical protein [Marinobacter sp. CHS3-4]
MVLNALPRPHLPRALSVSLLVTVMLFVVLVLVNQPLQTSPAPKGIISLQMAGSLDHVREILASWNGEGMAWARASLWLDFAFAPAYVLTLLLLTRHLSRDRPGVRERTVTRWVRGMFIGAGTCDVAENILLLNSLESPSESLNLAATLFALAKFTGLILGLAGLVILRAARRHPLSRG